MGGKFILVFLIVGMTKCNQSYRWIGRFVGMANAIKLIDGLDGLASGITLFGLLAVSVVAYLGEISSVIWMSTLLIGCLLGFLV